MVVPGDNQLGGSFYVNSPVTGNWEDFVVQEVVGYVDNHYRTIARVESRGISGHSMGGFGSLNIAMLHPDVFGAVYSLSPGLFDKNGLANSQFFNVEYSIQKFLDGQKAVLAKPEDQQLEAVLSNARLLTSHSIRIAFAPAPKSHLFTLIILTVSPMASLCVMTRYGSNGKVVLAVSLRKFPNTRIIG